MTTKRLELDDTGGCYAKELNPGLWLISQERQYGIAHKVYLTSETITYISKHIGEPAKTEQCFCQSFAMNDGTIADCTCGKCY